MGTEVEVAAETATHAAWATAAPARCTLTRSAAVAGVSGAWKEPDCRAALAVTMTSREAV